MKRRLAMLAAALLLPVGAVALPAAPAAAAPGPGAPPAAGTAASREMLTALQRDLGVSADEARALLESPAGRRTMDEYFRRWLGYDLVSANQRDQIPGFAALRDRSPISMPSVMLSAQSQNALVRSERVQRGSALVFAPVAQVRELVESFDQFSGSPLVRA